MNINCDKILTIFLFIFLGFSQVLNAQTVIDKSNGETESSFSAYYCELQSHLTVNGITKFEVIQYWDELNSLRMALTSFTDNGGLKLEDYMLEENDKIYLLLKNIPKEINVSTTILVGFHFNEKRKLNWSIDKLIKLDTFQNIIFKKSGNELVLSKRGEYVKFEYSLEGNYNCENEELTTILVDANLNQKIFNKWFKSHLRDYFGNYSLDEIKVKSKENLLLNEINKELRNQSCFNFSKIELKLE